MDEISQLEMRGDQVWELLQDPTLPPLDRDELVQELEWITERLMDIEDEDVSTLESCDSESIGRDEYDREFVIVYGQTISGTE